MDFSKKIVSLVIAINILFTIAVLWLFYKTQEEPQVLIGAWFAFTTGELWAIAKIKRDKVKHRVKKGEDCNDGNG